MCPRSTASNWTGKGLSIFKMHGSLMCPIFLCSVVFYEFIKDTKKGMIYEAVLLTSCKHEHKLQLNCVYHDFLICNEQLAGSYPHSYKMLCLINAFGTVHHRSPLRAKQIQSTYSKTTSSFQYYPSIIGYDFQSVSSLHNCNSNFKRHMAPTI